MFEINRIQTQKGRLEEMRLLIILLILSFASPVLAGEIDDLQALIDHKNKQIEQLQAQFQVLNLEIKALQTRKILLERAEDAKEENDRQEGGVHSQR